MKAVAGSVSGSNFSKLFFSSLLQVEQKSRATSDMREKIVSKQMDHTLKVFKEIQVKRTQQKHMFS